MIKIVNPARQGEYLVGTLRRLDDSTEELIAEYPLSVKLSLLVDKTLDEIVDMANQLIDTKLEKERLASDYEKVIHTIESITEIELLG